MGKVDLTEKEMIIAWSVVAWFQVKGLASGTLVRKFYPGADSKKQYRYDKLIEDRIIDIGKFLERQREAGQQGLGGKNG